MPQTIMGTTKGNNNHTTLTDNSQGVHGVIRGYTQNIPEFLFERDACFSHWIETPNQGEAAIGT